MIKRIFFACGIIAATVACNSNEQKTETVQDVNATGTEEFVQASKGEIEFENSVYDFGTVTEGAVVDHIFKFKNTGEEPVILTQVSASCGCTTPDYTKDPVLPGKEGEIKVSFNSEGQVGLQQKIVTVSSNAGGPQTVQIKGTVEAKK